MSKSNLLITNAKIFGENGRTRFVSIYVADGKITKIIRERNPSKRPGKFPIFDAGGKMILPGFIDCHCHMFSVGELEKEVKLFGSESIAEFQDRIIQFDKRAKFLKKGDWIFGRGWDQDRFRERRMPSKVDLDSLKLGRPLVMIRVCGHIAVMNSAAISFFEQRGAFLDSSDGTVEQDSRGRTTGIIKETTLAQCWNLLPVSDVSELKNEFCVAQDKALSYGIIGVHCILSENWRHEIRAIRELDREEKLILKTSILLPVEALPTISNMKARRRRMFLTGKRFTAIGFKLYADGSLGARTAALNYPYNDDPNNSGILNYKDSKIISVAQRVKAIHLILAVHAIGDRAIEQVIRCFLLAGIGRKDNFRIEHVSVLSRPLVRKLGVPILCVQPMFAKSDYWIEKRIGTDKKKRFAYAFKTLSHKSAMIAGSDAPVETLNPLPSIESAIRNPILPGESLSLQEGLQLYTSTASLQSPVTFGSGKIAVGRCCDLIVFDNYDANRLSKSKITRAFIDGRSIEI